MSNIKKILYILSVNNVYSLFFILFLTLLNTILEIIGIGLIIPILGIFVGQNYEKYFEFYPFLKNIPDTKILLYIFIIFNIIYLLKFFTSIYSILVKNKFYWGLYKNLSNTIFNNYINKDYLAQTAIHSSEKINTIRGEANIFSFGVTSPIVDLIIDLILLFSICVFLLFYNIKLSFFVIVFLLSISFLWNKYYNKQLDNLGKKREIHSRECIKEIQNSFGNFRETIILGLRKLFSYRFELHNKEFSSVGIKRDTIIQIPRFLLELVSVTGISIIVFVLIESELSLSEIMILLGVFVFATVRMLPSVTKVIKSLQYVKFNNIVIDKIYKEIYYFKNSKKNREEKSREKIDFKKLSIKNLNFNYPNSNNLILKNIDLNITKGEKIGIIGQTGSGKSTLINIISGLISVKSQELKVNDITLDPSSVASWQSNIGYVSDDVFLLDETIGYNISLKEDYKTEEKKLIELLKKVELLEFVEKQPLNLDMIVGEKGSKLSRGQTQRLGIARALYIDPSILIFDEATSALDVNTEKNILEKLNKKSENLTIISISHRKSSLELCDKIFEINDGQLKEIVNN